MTRLYSFYFATVIRFAPPFKIWDRQRAIEYTLLPSFWSFFFTALYIARQWHSWHCTLRAGRSSVKVLLGAYWCSKGREVPGDLPGLLVVPYWSPYSALPMLYYWFLSPLTTISALLLSWHPLLGLVPVLSALYKARLTWWWYGGLPEDLSDPLLPVVSANRMVQWSFSLRLGATFSLSPPNLIIRTIVTYCCPRSPSGSHKRLALCILVASIIIWPSYGNNVGIQDCTEISEENYLTSKLLEKLLFLFWAFQSLCLWRLPTKNCSQEG